MTFKWIKPKILIPLTLTIGFIATSIWLITSPPQSKRKKIEYVVPTVNVMMLKKDSFNVTVQAQGLIKPVHSEVILTPQVTGRIIDFHQNFKPGGIIPAGEIIIQIEALDYELAVKEAAAILDSAQAAMMLENGQQLIAKAEFKLDRENGSSNDDRARLALRYPQLKIVKAEKTIAQINYDKAKLALERAALTLPYDAVILEILSTIGETASVGSTLAKLARADSVWLDLKIQQKYLTRFKVKSVEQAGSKATFQFNGHSYQGEVISIRANLASSTRMGSVMVRVANTNFSNSTATDILLPPLRIGSYVEATLQAGTITNAFKIPRKALTDNGQIYVVDGQSKLQLRDIKIQWLMPDSLIIQPDLQWQDRLIVNRVAGIAPSSKVNALNVCGLKPC